MSVNDWKVVVLHDNPKWFTKIEDAVREYGVTIEEWISDESSMDLTSSPPEKTIFYNRCSPTAHTRGHALSLDQARVVIKWLRHHGAVVINGLPAIEIENSKAYQYMIAQSCGLNIPKTLFTSKLSTDLIIKYFGTDTPFVVKPDRGGHGIDMKMFHNAAEFEADRKPMSSYTGLYLVQKYVPPTSGLYRAEFVGQEFLYVSKALMCDGFSSNFCPDDLPEERFQILKSLDDPVIENSKKLFQTPELHNGAVEFLYGPDGAAYVIDINCNTVYNTRAELDAGVKPGWKTVGRLLYDTILKESGKRVGKGQVEII